MPASRAPREPYEIAWGYLGTQGVEGIWANLPKNQVFDPGVPDKPEGHVRRALAMELSVGDALRYVLYTIDMPPYHSDMSPAVLRSLKAECLVLDPSQPIATNQVVLMAAFGTNECHLDLPEIRWRVRERGANLLAECEAALRSLLALAKSSPEQAERFVTTLHEPPTGASRASLSVYTVSGGIYGSNPRH